MSGVRYYLGAGQPSFDLAVPQGKPTVDTPFGEDEPTHLVFTQVMMQRLAAYRRPPPNDRCPPEICGHALAYFCGDSVRQPLLGGLCTFTRTWATVPAAFTEYDQIAVQMPARGAVFRQDIGSSGGDFYWYPYLAAKSYSLPRRASILRAFFLIGTDRPGVDCDYTSPTAVPALNETIYAGGDVTTSGSGPLTDDQYTGIPAQNVGLFSGAVLDPGGSTSGSGNLTYVASGLSAGNYYVGQSELHRYLGNIYERTAVQITI